MLEFMGNCMHSWRRTKKSHMDVTIAILGLDNSGKTVTSKSLQKVATADVEPTVGFESCEIQCDNATVTIFDLGGGCRIRDIWTNYLAEVHGLIYVVDSSTLDRMEECRRTLHQLLTDRRVNGKPVLILANKQDIVGSLDEIDVCEHLQLENLVNKVRCPCKIKMCSALPKSENGKLDISITSGINWILDIIRYSIEDLNKRREDDMSQQKSKESAERKARQERVKKLKDDKAKKEQRERELRGETLSPSTDEDNGDDKSDPFKRINESSFLKKDVKSSPSRKLSGFHSDDENSGINRRLSNLRKPPSLDHFGANLSSKTNQFDSMDRQNQGLTPITTRLQPLDALTDSRNKRKTRRNQTLPASVDDSSSDYLSNSKLNSQVSFRARQRQKESLEATSDFSSKWGIVDELPALANEI